MQDLGDGSIYKMDITMVDMKKSLLFLFAIAWSFIAFAQEPASYKRLESNIQLAGGMFTESGNSAHDVFPGAVLRISYGLDVRLNENWSLMPGIGTRAQAAEINHIGWVGGDPDSMEMIDFFCQGRYHFEADGTRMVAGFGPQLSYMNGMDWYYVDADPNDPIDGKDKFTRWSVSLLPSISFLQGKHFQWGFEASFGLSNSMKQYPEYNRTGTILLHYFAVTCGWHW